ncbi:MAG TPA: ricin-type beta-trefoil lectin domain protein [Streptosporangiaceae bacterium]|jgi:hypothetical protein
MVYRSVSALLVSVATIGGTCLAASAVPVTSAAAKTKPASAVTLPAPVSQTPVGYTPDVFSGGACGVYCSSGDGQTIYSTTVVNGEVIVGGAFGMVCAPAQGATYAACPNSVGADFLFAFNLQTGMIDPNFTPVFDTGPVYAVTAGPNNTVYVGGAFNTVDGTSSRNIAQLYVDPGGSDDGQPVPGFAASTDGAVGALAYNGNALYLAGAFGNTDGSKNGATVARVNATTGALDPSFQFTLTEVSSGRSTPRVKTLALSPDGNTLAIAGDFLQVDGQSVPRLALINTGGALGSTATLDNWAAPIFATNCVKQTSFINSVDFSADGSYLVVADTGDRSAGGTGSVAACDSAMRFETGATGDDVQPVWQNFTGADTLDSADIVGDVVYLGGHNRWANNECGNNIVCEPNAVLENGLSALDANTGIALPWWHPQTGRGIGLQSLTAFPAGAFPGSDGGLLVGMGVDSIGGATHDDLAIFPETTTTAPTPGGPIMSGIWSDGRPGTEESSGPATGVPAECMDDTGNSTTSGTKVELVTCSNDNEQNWTINSDGTIGVNGLCLDTAGATTGSVLLVNTCDGDASQQWQQGTGNTVVNRGSGLCLNDPSASTTSGTVLRIATCNGEIQQSWPLPVAQAPPPPPASGPLYGRLLHGDNTLCTKYLGKKAEISECFGEPNQEWTVEANGTIEANATGLCLDTQGAATVSGTPIVLATCDGAGTQAWTWKAQADNSYHLINTGSGLCLDTPAATYGTQLEIATCNSTYNEEWRPPTY